MSQNVIFCFSGTGNCFHIARTIARKLGDTDIIQLDRLSGPTDVTDAATVGFVVPCHAGGLPLGVRESLKNIVFSFSSHLYGVCSYSGYIGNGLKELSRTVPLNYWAGISHHCSCIWLFQHTVMMPMLSVEDAQKRSEELAEKVAEDVLARKFSDKPVPYSPVFAVESKAWPSLAARKAKAFTVSDRCIACGQCMRLCPKGNIRTINGKASIGTDCIQCLRCLQFCPEEAISLGGVSEKREHYHNPAVRAADLMEPVIHIE
jgi:ferredoxin